MRQVAYKGGPRGDSARIGETHVFITGIASVMPRQAGRMRPLGVTRRGHHAVSRYPTFAEAESRLRAHGWTSFVPRGTAEADVRQSSKRSQEVRDHPTRENRAADARPSHDAGELLTLKIGLRKYEKGQFRSKAATVEGDRRRVIPLELLSGFPAGLSDSFCTCMRNSSGSATISKPCSTTWTHAGRAAAPVSRCTRVTTSRGRAGGPRMRPEMCSRPDRSPPASAVGSCAVEAVPTRALPLPDVSAATSREGEK